METWKQLSERSLRAAEILFREGEYRSCVSRAYYAAYCAATEEIVKKLTTFPNAWNNPPHVKVPVYVQNNMTLPQSRQTAIVNLINGLRLMRESADYRPQVIVTDRDARDCIRDATTLLKEFDKGAI